MSVLPVKIFDTFEQLYSQMKIMLSCPCCFGTRENITSTWKSSDRTKNGKNDRNRRNFLVKGGIHSKPP
jgi:hypothetical protein